MLIFRLGRPDVLPVSDFGVRQGFQLAYGKRKMPTPKELARHGERWRLFARSRAWYMCALAVELYRDWQERWRTRVGSSLDASQGIKAGVSDELRDDLRARPGSSGAKACRSADGAA